VCSSDLAEARHARDRVRARAARHLDRRLLVTTSVGLGANVILNLLFIPRWGIAGAAAATVIAEALTVVLLLVQVKRRLSHP